MSIVTIQASNDLTAAYEAGKTIEVAAVGTNKWFKVTKPSWHYSMFKYRVANTLSDNMVYTELQIMQRMVKGAVNRGKPLEIKSGETWAYLDRPVGSSVEELVYRTPRQIATDNHLWDYKCELKRLYEGGTTIECIPKTCLYTRNWKAVVPNTLLEWSIYYYRLADNTSGADHDIDKNVEELVQTPEWVVGDNATLTGMDGLIDAAKDEVYTVRHISKDGKFLSFTEITGQYAADLFGKVDLGDPMGPERPINLETAKKIVEVNQVAEVVDESEIDAESIPHMCKVMEAAHKGAKIEYRLRESGKGFITCKLPHWDWGYYEYRVKPTPKYVELDTQGITALVGKVIVSKNGIDRREVLGNVSQTGVAIIDGGAIIYLKASYLLEHWVNEDGTPVGLLVK